MRFFYNIFPDAVGGLYYYPEPMCGDIYQLHLKVFNMFEWRLNGFGEHKINLNKHLYKKHKGGK